jgi:hypothetical protein
VQISYKLLTAWIVTMISIKTTTALIMAVTSVLGVAPIAASAQPGDQIQIGVIDDSDTNTQVNSATQVLTQRDGSNNAQAAAASQSNSLDDNDVNTLAQGIG